LSLNPKAILCQNIIKRFKSGSTEVLALSGLSLDIEAGKLLMIVGPSGSGKTTLISIIAGILQQDEGECTVLGKNLKALSDLEKTRFRGANIGFVFQAFNLIPTLTAQENVCVPLLLNNVSLPEALEKSADLLNRFGLGEKLNEFPINLSGGQQQRVAIARSCIHGPGLIVCDEPSSALDHETGSKVIQLLRDQVNNNRTTVVIVTHDARIFSFADRIVKLDDGKIVKEGINPIDK